MFEPSEEPVQFCVLHRPHGTIIEVTVDDFGPSVHRGKNYRSHHMELNGGLCTGDTDYYSHFSAALERLTTEDEFVQHGLELAEKHFVQLHPKVQFAQIDLFEQPTT